MIELNAKLHSTDKKIFDACVQAWDQAWRTKESGFFYLPERHQLWSASQKRAQEIRASAKNIGVLGIGGSSLGAKALIQSQLKTDRPVVFFENLDDAVFWSRLPSKEQFKDWHWIVVSKSGTTLETLAQVSALLERHPEFIKQCTVVTELKESPLFSWAKQNNVSVLEVPLDVGGRFSVLSPVGLLPAACAGIALDPIRSGADWALKQKELVCELAAQSLMSWQREEWICLKWVYSDRLLSYAQWWQQLWSESLGKQTDKSGKKAERVSTPMTALGANDQHSILQQVIDGDHDKMVWLVRSKDAESGAHSVQTTPFAGLDFINGKSLGQLLAAEAQATQDVFKDKGISHLTLQMKDIGPGTMGALFMLAQLVVAVLGQSIGISTYDQPAVELGKVKAKKILRDV